MTATVAASARPKAGSGPRGEVPHTTSARYQGSRANPQGLSAANLPAQRKALYDWLGNAVMTLSLRTALKPTDLGAQIRPPALSMRDALKGIRAPGVREALEAMEIAYTNTAASLGHAGWPPFHFILAGLDTSEAAAGPFTNLTLLASSTSTEFAADPLAPPNVAPQAADVDRLTALVGRALEATEETNAPPLPFALHMKNALSATAGDPGWYVVRFVYQRRDCGPLHRRSTAPHSISGTRPAGRRIGQWHRQQLDSRPT